MNMLEKHQKLATFNWYSPLCTGNIAFNVLKNKSVSANQGNHIMQHTPNTVAPIMNTYKHISGIAIQSILAKYVVLSPDL